MKRKILFLLHLFLLLVSGVQAAPGAPVTTPLEGPLIAADTAAQDRIVIYDIGTGAQRELTFGTGWQRVWDFSPDGCRIVFTSSDGSEPASLLTAKLDGSDVQSWCRPMARRAYGSRSGALTGSPTPSPTPMVSSTSPGSTRRRTKAASTA